VNDDPTLPLKELLDKLLAEDRRIRRDVLAPPLPGYEWVAAIVPASERGYALDLDATSVRLRYELKPIRGTLREALMGDGK
jgi:hypothetical protein